MNKTLLDKFYRLIRFSASTVAGTVVDLFVLWLLKQFVFKGWYYGEYMISPAISFFFALITNYTLAYFVVWKDRISQRSIRSFFRHFLGYGLSCIGGFLIKLCFLLVIERILHWDVLICSVLAQFLSGGFNFVLNEWVIFGNKPTVEEDVIEEVKERMAEDLAEDLADPGNRIEK